MQISDARIAALLTQDREAVVELMMVAYCGVQLADGMPPLAEHTTVMHLLEEVECLAMERYRVQPVLAKHEREKIDAHS